ncbi:hypothetical protein Clacol_010620 [Clathrus columnatus]|uniref:Xylanolytic transcriptional activator regulatory domain-containing protein n=1 Tax=Clathrus columnatus TaxID=1419009 RepID=A0AAV5ANS7_9AGAM|nr:hypothetical protein Clacol_010620 [Clathrus columnatus]
MSSSPCPICQFKGGVSDLKALSLDNVDICATCRDIITPKNTKKKKAEPARSSQARPGRKPRAAPSERAVTTIPGMSRGPMVDSRRAMNENYSQLYAREQQLRQAVAELERQMALRNQPLPPAPRPILRTEKSGKKSPTDLDVDMLADAFGVMSMREKDQGQFVGPTAFSEIILQQCDKITNRRHSPGRGKDLPPPIQCLEDYPELLLLSAQFPYPPPQAPTELKRFLHHLPDYEQARQLFENYVYYVTWLASPISLSALSETLDLFYPDKCPVENMHLQKGHRLATFFAVCLLGSYFDPYPSDEERMTNCAKYRTLARAAMSAVPLSSSVTVAGIQCIILLIWFSRFSPTIRWDSVSDVQFWRLVAISLAFAFMLDTNGRDRYTYIQDNEAIRRVEQTFWEYYTQDIFQSYVFGRPVTLHPSSVSCQRPEFEPQDESHPEFHTWKYSMAMVMAEIIETTAKPSTTYNGILKLDRQIRKHPIPKGMEWPNSDEGTNYEPLGRICQRALGNILAQMSGLITLLAFTTSPEMILIVLMVVHRPYFWEAISKPDQDITKHPYWRSIVAAYHSASSLVSCIRAIWEAFPQTLERLAPFWSHCHSASLVLGAMVTLRPDSQFARESLRHLNATCEMFMAAPHATVHLAARLTSLYRLQTKAQQTYDNFIASTELLSDDALSPASLSCLDDVESPKSVDSKNSGQEDGMMLDPGVYRLQEKGWDHLILQLGRNN